MSHSPTRVTETADTASPRLARNKLGVIGIAFFVLAAAAPIGALAGATPLVLAGAGAGAPLVIVAAGLLLALFAVGYLRLGRQIENAGGFIVFVQKGLGAVAASAAAGIVTATYIGLSVGLWALFGLFAQMWIAQYLGVDVPVWLLVLVCIWVAIAMTIRGTDLGVKFLGTLLTLELIVAIILIIAILVQAEPAAFPTPAQSFEQVLNPGIGVALLFAYAMFTGFEAPMVFSEEARDPKRTIPRALYLVISVITVLYSLACWAFTAAVGSEKIAGFAGENLDALIYILASQYVGPWFEFVIQTLVVISFFAMMLASHNIFARYLFSLGRAGTLPAGLGAVSRRGVPLRAAVLVGAVTSLAFLPFALTGVDPFTTYSWMVGLGTAGFITILALASLSILVHFVKQREFSSPWSSIVAPALSLAANLGVLYLVIANYDAVGGEGVVSRILLLMIPILAVMGAVVARIRGDVKFDDVIG